MDLKALADRRCFRCGGVLSTAHLFLRCQLNYLDHVLESGTYEVACDDCGYVQMAFETKGDNDHDR